MEIKHKLVLLLGVPLAAVVYFASVQISNHSSEVSQMTKVVELTKLAGSVSALVHESQKERGMSAGYIGSRGAKFKDKLKQQYILTDGRYSALKSLFSEIDGNAFGAEFNEGIGQARARLEKMPVVRQKVQKFEYSAKEAVDYYTANNTSLLNLINQIVKASTQADITKESAAYVNFLQSKERAGIERAVLSNTFGADKFAPGFKNKFVSLVAEQGSYLSSFSALTTKEHNQYLKETLQGDAIDEVERMREIARKSDSGFNVDPVYWFSTITKKINLLKDIEDRLANDLYQRAESLKESSSVKFKVVLLITFVTVVATLLVAFFLYRSINGKRLRIDTYQFTQQPVNTFCCSKHRRKSCPAKHNPKPWPAIGSNTLKRGSRQDKHSKTTASLTS